MPDPARWAQCHGPGNRACLSDDDNSDTFQVKFTSPGVVGADSMILELTVTAAQLSMM